YAKITLNRPETLNSFNQLMHDELRTAIQDVIAREDIRCLLLTGAGRGFCAGQDLNDRKPLAPGEKRDLSESFDKNYYPLIRFLTEMDKP
ncbi:MAG TPA: 2-(1,2-epoxy-1,2-dihydrophenyl)acetyl-CoA isomerase, partial [Porticoccaceae bacterium]|nr:2-(1,2-epoxy-1,2-dihydrophenyl)acetyl-CoA isomerase [Porticoccaceae bacterium]